MNVESSAAADDPGRLTYNTREAAAALGVSPSTIYRLLDRGILKAVPFLWTKRISREQVRRLADGGLAMLPEQPASRNSPRRLR